jgi:hypothetical protein
MVKAPRIRIFLLNSKRMRKIFFAEQSERTEKYHVPEPPPQAGILGLSEVEGFPSPF